MSDIIDNYAKSLFNSALSSNKLEKISSDLKNFIALMDQSIDLTRFFYSKATSFVDKKLVIEKLAHNFDDIYTRFILLLAKNNRVKLLKKIQGNYQFYYRIQANIQAVKLTFANTPQSSELEKFTKLLSETYNSAIELEVDVDSKLIAGVVLLLKNNNTLLDLSLAEQMKSLANK
ncbi:MAG: ATP synthase F1 subunit delta [Rickettsiaceae bacterium]|nr:ATP synthase F1 subunit delta [Rickettsiaceae bacterium]